MRPDVIRTLPHARWMSGWWPFGLGELADAVREGEGAPEVGEGVLLLEVMTVDDSPAVAELASSASRSAPASGGTPPRHGTHCFAVRSLTGVVLRRATLARAPTRRQEARALASVGRKEISRNGHGGATGGAEVVHRRARGAAERALRRGRGLPHPLSPLGRRREARRRAGARRRGAREWWSFLAPQLASQYHVVAPDLSGHGDSGRREEYPRELWAREVMAVAADAGIIGAPVLVGPQSRRLRQHRRGVGLRRPARGRDHRRLARAPSRSRERGGRARPRVPQSRRRTPTSRRRSSTSISSRRSPARTPTSSITSRAIR